ncbi:unnamed protein product [Diamesa tonsa]
MLEGTDLDEKALQFAEEYLNETAEVREQSVLKIQEFLKENTLINAHPDRKCILNFLRSCKYDIEKTKKKMKSFYKQRAERVEWFLNRDPHLPEMADLLEVGAFLPLRLKDKENRQIVIIRTAAHNPSLHKQNNVFKLGKMILDVLVANDESIGVYGTRAIFDMKGISMGHAMQMTPSIIKRAVDSWESYPARTQSLEFVNSNLGINVVLDVFRSFMTQKMKKRIKVCRGKPEYNASDNLPPELGGCGDDYKTLTKRWKSILQQKRDFFLDDEMHKSEL